MRQFADDDVGAKEKILRETVRLMKTEGIDAITVRRIAAAARVNVGAINYYFDSKENLIDQAAAELVEQLRTFFSILDDTSISARERLRGFLVVFLRNHLSCAEPFRRVLSKIRCKPPAGHERFARIQPQLLNKLQETIAEITGEQDRQKLFLISIQLVCAAMFPNIILSQARAMPDAELPGPEEQIDTLLQFILK